MKEVIDRIRNESHYAVLDTIDEIILTDLLRSKYVKITLLNLLKCHVVHRRHYVCENRTPVFSAAVSETDCTVAMLHPSTRDAPSGCQYRHVRRQSSLFFMLDDNEYLFVSPTPDTLTIICNNNFNQFSLNGTGKIWLEYYCKAFTKYVTLQSFSEFKVTSNFNYVPIIKQFNLKSNTIVKML